MGKIISIYGSPSSGKTALSIKLAGKMSKSRKKNSGVLFCSIFPSPISYVFPGFRERDFRSVGEILCKENISEEDVLSSLISPSSGGYICFSGYSSFDHPGSFPNSDIKRCSEYIKVLSENLDFLFIDTDSFIHNSVLSKAALVSSQDKICVVSSDIKGASWLSSCRPLISSVQTEELLVINDPTGMDAPISPESKNTESKYRICLPYSSDLDSQFQSGNLLKGNTSKMDFCLESICRMVDGNGN